MATDTIIVTNEEFDARTLVSMNDAQIQQRIREIAGSGGGGSGSREVAYAQGGLTGDVDDPFNRIPANNFINDKDWPNYRNTVVTFPTVLANPSFGEWSNNNKFTVKVPGTYIVSALAQMWSWSIGNDNVSHTKRISYGSFIRVTTQTGVVGYSNGLHATNDYTQMVTHGSGVSPAIALVEGNTIELVVFRSRYNSPYAYDICSLIRANSYNVPAMPGYYMSIVKTA